MNKTVTINVSGIVFHIEEDAYDKLSKYLGTIKSYFKDSEGRDEIMADIEARIAELLKEKIGAGRQVVLTADVDHVISVMGKPEDYASGGEKEDTEGEKPEEVIDFSKRRRRVFRDPDSRVLGGVCGGIANYFDMDPLWLRLSLVVFTIFGGAGVLVYIILWIAIPEAKTTAEKLEMKGEKVNINNIKKTVEEELGHLKKKGKEMEEDLKNFSGPENRQKVKNGVDKFLEFLASVGTSFLTVFGKVFAIALIIIGVLFTVGLFTSVFGISNFGLSNAPGWIESVFTSAGDYELAVVAALLTLGIPFMMLIYGGFRLLLGIREKNRLLSVVALILWVVGIGIGIYSGVSLGTDFRENGRVKEVYTLNTSSDTLFLRGILPTEDEMEGIDGEIRDVRHKGNNKDWDFMNMNGEKIRFGFPDLTVEKADGDSFQIEIIRTARGIDKKDALNRARNILYKAPGITDSVVEFYSVSEFDRSNKLRAQDVKIIVRVPVGKSVFLSKTLSHLLYDVPNVHDLWDEDMLNHTWNMTTEGLDCRNCEGLDIHGERVRVGKGEVHLKKGNEEIHIKDGEIRIKKLDSTDEKHKEKKETEKTTSVGFPDLNGQFRIGIPFVGLGWGI
ncbi:MAG: PspC domain-containing protein [Bacteroidia bacterium]|nr:PspC domain-containing protein [Bacteroidia bacterium]